MNPHFFQAQMTDVYKHVVGYSIAQGDIVNVITFASEPSKDGSPFQGPWVTDVPQAELLECYTDWEPEVVELLSVRSSSLLSPTVNS